MSSCTLLLDRIILLYSVENVHVKLVDFLKAVMQVAFQPLKQWEIICILKMTTKSWIRLENSAEQRTKWIFFSSSSLRKIQ